MIFLQLECLVLFKLTLKFALSYRHLNLGNYIKIVITNFSYSFSFFHFENTSNQLLNVNIIAFYQIFQRLPQEQVI